MSTSVEAVIPVLNNKAEGVLFVIGSLQYGGAERACLDHLNSLAGQRRGLVLLLGKGPLIGEVDPAVTVCDLGFDQHHSYRFKPFYTWALLRQAREIARLAHDNRSDVVASFLTHGNVSAILAKVLFNRRLKVIINVHDVTSLIIGRSRISRYEGVMLKRFLRLLYPRAALVVAAAGAMRDDLISHFGVPRAKIAVIHNPIDPARLRARAADPVTHPWFANRDGLVVVAVGRLVKLKGFDLLIQAFARVTGRDRARLIIIGDGNERSALQALVEGLGVGDRVALPGFQDNPWKYMARADLFVLSSHVEGLPNVIAEAMALGLPVLATSCSESIRDYMEDGRNGLLVPPGDVDALSEGLGRLLADRSLRQALARGALERAAAFDARETARMYEAALARVRQG